MSYSLNRVEVIGNVGKDPEVRYTKAGEPLVSFSVAASDKWKDKAGKPQERTEWFNVTVFGGLAKVAQSYVTKGSKVYVSGQLRTEEWTDNDGGKRYSTKVVLSGPQSNLILLGGGARTDASPPKSDPGAFVASDEDLPFSLVAALPALLPVAVMATLIGGLV